MVVGVSNLNIVNSTFVSIGIYLKLNNFDAFVYFKACFFYMLTMHALNFFVYFFFNRLFRQILCQTFKDLNAKILNQKAQIELADDQYLAH